jgi:hypothetical protein
LKELARQVFALVGADCERRSLGFKRLERRHGAGEGPALGGDIGLVVDQELGQHRVQILFCSGPPQRLLDHDAGALADAGADRLGGYGLMPAPHQHVVQRVHQVGRRVDQGAVEVEHDGGVA